MNSQQLLFINLIIVVVLALFFSFRRLKRKHSPMFPEFPEPDFESLPEPEPEPEPLFPEIPRMQKEKTYFVYNGHEWEAFEVLGLPTTVSLDVATRHYQELIRSSDPSTFEFYDAAFTCILKLRRGTQAE